ncbi:MAG: DeoR family transcriptional regulator, partial [Spirochaetia bacterium]
MAGRTARIEKIIDLLKEHNGASIRELSEALNVSLMTVRRDLTDLANDSVVKLIFGGVILNPERVASDPAEEYLLQVEKEKHAEEKERIGEK